MTVEASVMAERFREVAARARATAREAGEQGNEEGAAFSDGMAVAYEAAAKMVERAERAECEARDRDMGRAST